MGPRSSLKPNFWAFLPCMGLKLKIGHEALCLVSSLLEARWEVVLYRIPRDSINILYNFNFGKGFRIVYGYQILAEVRMSNFTGL